MMLYKTINNNKAFTLMEAIIVIIIVAIAVAIWGFYGRDHMKIAMMTEAKMFIDKIVAQEKIYYANNGDFVDTGENTVTELNQIFINAGQNKYFNNFEIMAERVDGIVNFLKITLKPNLDKYEDLSGYYIIGLYSLEKDTIVYDEYYG